MQYGLLSKEAKFSSDTTVYLGRNINRIAFIQEKIGAGSYMMTHKYTIDHRFDEVHSRMLSEFYGIALYLKDALLLIRF